MRILTSLVVALFLATSMSPVLATSVPKRQQKQERRIERGIKNGKITPRERAEEQHDLNALNKDIYRKKHNKRRVYQ